MSFKDKLRKICCLYTLGLSATPTRSDGLSKVIYWHLGDIMYKEDRKPDNKVLVKIFNYTSDDKKFKEKKKYIQGKVKQNSVKMINNICNLEGRNKFILDILYNLLKNPDRKTLILSGRRDHLTYLKNKLDIFIKEEEKKENLELDELKTAFYMGGMKEKELKISTEADIIFATYNMAEEGLDIDKLNTLILASPKKNIIQSIGRIMRKPIKEGDVQPLILDIFDELSIFIKHANKRDKYYNKNNYQINKYNVFNYNLLSYKQILIKLLDIFQAFCIKHWLTNLLIFSALVFSTNLFDMHLLILTLGAFFRFGLTSSSIYLLIRN